MDPMTYTTIDIENLKKVKREALERDITLKELVNRSIQRNLEETEEKST